MTLRVRTNLKDTVTGSFSNNAGWTGGGWTPTTRSKFALAERVTDEVAKDDNHLFAVERMSFSHGLANIEWFVDGNPAVKMTFQNWPLFETFAESSVFDGLKAASLTAVSNSTYATRLMARTNPNRPSIDLPVFLFELKDIPEMFKLAGNTIFKKIAKQNLAYHFAWKPLVSDMMKILNFHDIVEGRYQELKRLYSRGLRRTVELDRYASHGSYPLGGTLPLSVPYGPTCMWGGGTSSRTHIVRGHIKWKPDGLPPGGDMAMRNLAMRAALGLYASPASAWEVIPFSWLSDWFLGIGDYLNATRNFIPCHVTDLSIMHNMRNDFVVHPQVAWSSYVAPSYIQKQDVQDISGFHESKSRVPTAATPTVSAQLDWLSATQWSILGSLAVTKMK